ncbi:MAG TPA: hypothetical protein VGI58_01860 [Streptosporangiaceae bacterium]|jgi:cell division protein FtsW (lipid II flippase)
MADLKFVATICWAGTDCAGLGLLIRWLAAGRPRRQSALITAFPAVCVVAHPALALAGLAAWVAFLVTGAAGLAWCAFATLAVSAMLGFVLLTRWLGGRGGRHARLPRQRFPASLVALHGVVGLSAFGLTLMAATLAGQTGR